MEIPVIKYNCWCSAFGTTSLEIFPNGKIRRAERDIKERTIDISKLENLAKRLDAFLEKDSIMFGNDMEDGYSITLNYNGNKKTVYAGVTSDVPAEIDSVQQELENLYGSFNG